MNTIKYHTKKTAETQKSLPRIENKYRYYCERCTNAAFYTPTNEPMVAYVQDCMSCGQPVIRPIKKENFIAL